MSNFFQELNLPLPIDEITKEKILDIKRESVFRPYLFLTRTPETFLNKEILSIFSKINIFPDTMIVFGHVDDFDYSSVNSLIHSDIIFNQNQWKKVPFAINWEFDDINPVIKWWDTSALLEIYPKGIPKTDFFKYGQGIHYGSRRNTDSSKMVCLEQHTMIKSRAVMIRTEIPHSVYYDPGSLSRTSVSLRFSTDKIFSWELALNTFKNFLSMAGDDGFEPPNA